MNEFLREIDVWCLYDCLCFVLKIVKNVVDSVFLVRDRFQNLQIGLGLSETLPLVESKGIVFLNHFVLEFENFVKSLLEQKEFADDHVNRVYNSSNVFKSFYFQHNSIKKV